MSATPEPTDLPGFPVSGTSMLIGAARSLLKQVVGTLLEPHDLTPHQLWMLLVLRESGPQSLSELASRMWLDHPTASRLAHGLEDRGFLTVERHPQQGRRVSIALRADHAEELEALARLAEAFREELEAGVSPEQKAVFRTVMETLLRNLGSIHARQKPGSGA